MIEVEIDNKIIKIDGEIIIGGFAASIKSMESWEPHHENELFNDLNYNSNCTTQK